jgi:hypothetical protein
VYGHGLVQDYYERHPTCLGLRTEAWGLFLPSLLVYASKEGLIATLGCISSMLLEEELYAFRALRWEGLFGREAGSAIESVVVLIFPETINHRPGTKHEYVTMRYVKCSTYHTVSPLAISMTSMAGRDSTPAMGESPGCWVSPEYVSYNDSYAVPYETLPGGADIGICGWVSDEPESPAGKRGTGGEVSVEKRRVLPLR